MSESERPTSHVATRYLKNYCLPRNGGAAPEAVPLEGTVKLAVRGGRDVSTAELFPGATPFMPWHFSVFSGRYLHAEHVIERITRHSFVAVLGGSGTGKSSLVFAGVLPVLLSQDTGSVPAQWVPVVFKPDVSPLANLASNLAFWFDALTAHIAGRYQLAPPEQQPDWYKIIFRDLHEPFGLRSVIDRFHGRLDKMLRDHPAFKASRPVRYRFLLVIDQFEESFTQTPKHERDLFFERLSEELPTHFDPADIDPDEALAAEDGIADIAPEEEASVPAGCAEMETPYAVLLSMRSEYLESCQEYARLIDAINEALYILPALTNEEVVSALAHAFVSAAAPPVDPSRYTMDASLRAWLLQELDRWQERHGSEQDSLALAQVVLRALWLEALKSGSPDAFPLTEQHLKDVAEKVRSSADPVTLSRVFQWIVTDTLRDRPRLEAIEHPVGSRAREWFRAAYPLTGIADVTYMKYSKRSFRASEVRARLEDLHRGGLLSFLKGRLPASVPPTAAITRQLYGLCPERTLLPVLRKIGSGKDGVFELCHEAFIRRWPPLRVELEAVGLRSIDAANLARSASKRLPARWAHYVINFISINLLKLLTVDRTVSRLIVERAALSLRRTAATATITTDSLRHAVHASLLAPFVATALGFVILVGVGYYFSQTGAASYARTLEALYKPLQKEIAGYDKLFSANVIRVFAIMNDRLKEVEEYFIPEDWQPPDLGTLHVNNLLVNPKVVWTTDTAIKAFPETPPTSLLHFTNNDGHVYVSYKNELISHYDKMLKPEVSSGRIIPCTPPPGQPDLKDAREFGFVIVQPPEKRSAAAKAPVAGSTAAPANFIQVDWWMALDPNRPAQLYPWTLPEQLKPGDAIISPQITACFKPVDVFEAIEVHLRYEIISSGAAQPRPVQRRFLTFVDRNSPFPDRPAPDAAASRKAAEALYAELKSFCEAEKVRSNDPVPQVLEKFKKCLTPGSTLSVGSGL
jgi:hypothetical protein